MNKVIVLGVSAVGVTAASIALSGTSVAAADEYAGQTYATASSQLSAQGQTAVIAGRVGGAVPDDECIVTRSQPSVRYSLSGHVVYVYLNCTARLASATHTP